MSLRELPTLCGLGWAAGLLVLLSSCWSPPLRSPIVVQQRASDWNGASTATGLPIRLVVRPFHYVGEEPEAARRGVRALILALEKSGRFVVAPCQDPLAPSSPTAFPPKLPSDFYPDLVLIGQVIDCRPYPPQSFGLSLRFEEPLTGAVSWQGSGVFDAASTSTRADLENWVEEAFANDSRAGARNETLLSLERFHQYVATRWLETLTQPPPLRH